MARSLAGKRATQTSGLLRNAQLFLHHCHDLVSSLLDFPARGVEFDRIRGRDQRRDGSFAIHLVPCRDLGGDLVEARWRAPLVDLSDPLALRSGFRRCGEEDLHVGVWEDLRPHVAAFEYGAACLEGEPLKQVFHCRSNLRHARDVGCKPTCDGALDLLLADFFAVEDESLVSGVLDQCVCYGVKEALVAHIFLGQPHLMKLQRERTEEPAATEEPVVENG